MSMLLANTIGKGFPIKWHYQARRAIFNVTKEDLEPLENGFFGLTEPTIHRMFDSFTRVYFTGLNGLGKAIAAKQQKPSTLSVDAHARFLQLDTLMRLRTLAANHCPGLINEDQIPYTRVFFLGSPVEPHHDYDSQKALVSLGYPPMNPTTANTLSLGFVTADGRFFNCSNVSRMDKSDHHFFVFSDLKLCHYTVGKAVSGIYSRLVFYASMIEPKDKHPYHSEHFIFKDSIPHPNEDRSGYISAVRNHFAFGNQDSKVPYT